MLVAMGWSNERIAGALNVTQPTLRKHYFAELKLRAVARDRVDSEVLMKLWDGVQAGSVSAIRQFRAEVERNDLMQYGQTQQPAPAEKAVKQPKLGKKEEAQIAAQSPDPETPMGELMARRQQATH